MARQKFMRSGAFVVVVVPASPPPVRLILKKNSIKHEATAEKKM
jgi:hypothetical protein